MTPRDLIEDLVQVLLVELALALLSLSLEADDLQWLSLRVVHDDDDDDDDDDILFRSI
jgi:hypothetical protein